VLAVEAERRGDGPAWIVDTDQQATLSTWHDRREAEAPRRADIPFARLRARLRELAEKHAGRLAFIDTAPADSPDNAAIFGISDLVLIPVRPSPADLWAVGPTVAQVRSAGPAAAEVAALWQEVKAFIAESSKAEKVRYG
jgi:chromosome partitioning protein